MFKMKLFFSFSFGRVGEAMKNTLQNETKNFSKGEFHSDSIRVWTFLSLNSSRASNVPYYLSTHTLNCHCKDISSFLLKVEFSPTQNSSNQSLEDRELSKEESTERQKENEIK